MKRFRYLVYGVCLCSCTTIPEIDVHSLIAEQRARPFSSIKTGEAIITGYLTSWYGHLVLVGSEKNEVCQPVGSPGVLVLLARGQSWKGADGTRVRLQGFMDDESEFKVFAVPGVIPPLGKDFLIGPLRHARITMVYNETCKDSITGLR